MSFRHMARPSAAAGIGCLAALAALAAPAAAQQAAPTSTARAVETPNGALSLSVPEGWAARPLKSGIALEPPGNPLEETIIAACEPFALPSVSDEAKLDDLLGRLRAGQLASVEETPRPRRERVNLPGGVAAVVTYKGTDDGGRPAALRIAVLPSEGRVALLSARLPWKRLELRAPDLDRVLASFALVPAAEEKALEKRLAGTWRSEAAPLVALRFLPNGTFEEQRESGRTTPVAQRPSQTKQGTFDVIGREVRMKFDDGEARAFRIDAEQPGEFTSAGQVWKRIGD